MPLLDFQLSLSPEDEELAMLLMEDEKETNFGATVRQAWEVSRTNEKGGESSELMLFCWVFADNAQNCIAHAETDDR